MMKIEVSKKYRITQLSSNNNEVWKSLRDLVKSTEGVIVLNFRDVIIRSPWENRYFLEIFKMPNIRFEIYDEVLVEKLKLHSQLGLVDPERIIKCEEDEYDGIIFKDTEKINKDEQRVRDYEKDIEALTKDVDIGDKYSITVELNKRFTRLVDKLMVDALENFLRRVIEERNEKYNQNIYIYIDIEDMLCIVNLELLSMIDSIATDYKNVSIDIAMDDYDDYLKYVFKTYKKQSKMRLKDKRNYLLNFEKGRVGFLNQYKKNKKLDKFKRVGEGYVISCRVAIYKGLSHDGRVVFDVMNIDTVTNRVYYKTIGIEINQIGFGMEFLGELYHFNSIFSGLPMKYDPKVLKEINTIKTMGAVGYVDYVLTSAEGYGYIGECIIEEW